MLRKPIVLAIVAIAMFGRFASTAAAQNPFMIDGNVPANGTISDHWITLHETGNVSGFTPIVVMDVWEHAFILDYAPADRPKYIDAFFSNVDWDAVQGRLSKKVVAPAA